MLIHYYNGKSVSLSRRSRIHEISVVIKHPHNGIAWDQARGRIFRLREVE
jgi:hypothetical protein